MVWRSYHKEILLSEPGRNTNVGENAFIPELPLYVLFIPVSNSSHVKN